MQIAPNIMSLITKAGEQIANDYAELIRPSLVNIQANLILFNCVAKKEFRIKGNSILPFYADEYEWEPLEFEDVSSGAVLLIDESFVHSISKEFEPTMHPEDFAELKITATDILKNSKFALEVIAPSDRCNLSITEQSINTVICATVYGRHYFAK